MQEKQQLEYYKEGNLSESVGAIITLVVGVGSAVLILIFVGTLSGRMYNIVEPDIDAIGNTPVADQTFTALNSTAVSLGNSPIHTNSLSIFNGSNQVGLGNFTIDYSAGSVTLTNNAYNNTALNASYNYGNRTVPNKVKESIISGFNALQDTGELMPLIVISVVITLVLGIVVGLTMFSGGKGGMGKSVSAL